jgi:hypothetical protein
MASMPVKWLLHRQEAKKSRGFDVRHFFTGYGDMPQAL